jgi:tRNA-specific 2-thiouridylase
MSKLRVVVAMSGGVDSSVAAAFLKQKGYDVVGITMKLWDRKNRCCSYQDVQDAKQVARRLGIPHYTISFDEAFRNHIVHYFVSEYMKGRTPNPCAVCNPVIKFGSLLQKADSLNAQFLATGHYAGVRHDKNTGRFMLERGREKGKDQSYFLARLSQDALSRALFPIGNFPKSIIRQRAERLGLPVASKTESQEVCFMPDGDIPGFIEHQHGQKKSVPGPVVDDTGSVLGTHKGITGYTIGQRKGLGIAVGKPIYVTRIDAESNTVTVGGDKDLYHSTFIASDPNWISIPELNKTMRIHARIRYRHRPQWATLSPIDRNTCMVRFDRAQRAITPGQLAVFYNGDIVVGSAWIDQVQADTSGRLFR